MNKKEFLSKISYEDKILLSNIFEKIELSNKINKPIYLNEFYTPNVWKALLSFEKDLGIGIGTYGIFEDSDRRAISFLPYGFQEDLKLYQLNLIKIKNKSPFTHLAHSDFLGTLMGQGVKREKFGDLILKDQICYVPICKDILPYIKENLVKIGGSPCVIESIDFTNDEIPSYNFEEKIIIASSFRIDCVVSAFTGKSRAASAEMINKGAVLVDYERINEKDTDVKLNSIITVRGYGKFKIQSIQGKTQRDREKILIKKYI